MDLVPGAEEWEKSRLLAYADLALPSRADEVRNHIRDELAAAATALVDGIDENPFAALVGDKLAGSTDDVLGTQRARATCAASLRRGSRASG